MVSNASAPKYPAAIEVAAGWRFPFSGMDEVNKRAEELAALYAGTGSDVMMPRWDHFTVSLGIHWPLP